MGKELYLGICTWFLLVLIDDIRNGVKKKIEDDMEAGRLSV